MSAVANVPARDFEFFSEIIDSFKKASDSAAGPDLNNMHITPFLDAMTTFLRIFDAFSNPFFSDVVKKDVQGNIKVRQIMFQNCCKSFSRPN